MSVITIIGSGVMGSAMSFPARENGHEVRLVGTMLDREIIEHAGKTGYHLNLKRQLPDGNKYYQLEMLQDAIHGADLVIGGVSSFGVDWFSKELLPQLPDRLPILSVTKGMVDREDGSLVPFPHVYGEMYPNKRFYAIGGPCTSYELADHDQTTVSFCGKDMDELRAIKKLLHTSYYHISLSNDVVGVECAVAMKNAYALAVSLAVGISQRGGDDVQHYNSQAALFGQSVREMRKLLALCGASDDNIVLGAGDLYVTIFGGRTRMIGTLLGRGLSFEEATAKLKGVTLESIVIAERTGRAVRKLIARGVVAAGDFPLLLHIDDILTKGAAVDIPWDSFETETVL